MGKTIPCTSAPATPSKKTMNQRQELIRRTRIHDTEGRVEAVRFLDALRDLRFRDARLIDPFG